MKNLIAGLSGSVEMSQKYIKIFFFNAHILTQKLENQKFLLCKC